MELQEFRERINVIDAEMVQLFQKRMELTKEIAKCKKKNNLPFFDGARERELLNRVSELSDGQIERYTRVMFTTLMNLSKSYQHRLTDPASVTENLISNTLKETPMLFPEKAQVACQGVEGAYSQMACERLFPSPTITYFDQFDGVFKAVDEGECKYGILPLENSTAGSVNAIYDLMQKYRFYIVRTCRLQIDHALLCNKGASINDIKEVISHEQGILQCSEFLKTMPGIKVTVCANTAMASKIVAESGRKDLAAISSRRCAELYNLHILHAGTQNSDCNFTRFMCISKKPEIYPGANKTSIMVITSHKPGALYKVISKFYATDINLTKLESRPIPGRDFEFMFYFDMEVSVYSTAFLPLIGELESQLEEFQYLGSYNEII